MNMTKIKAPLLVGASRRGNTDKKRSHCNSNNHYLKDKKFNYFLLPTPKQYYETVFSNLKIKSEWTNVRCCFHHDSNPSLSINLISGGFHCFSCGASGGDVISFAMQRYHLTFKEACKQLGAWR
jgi:hypothetical protein